MRIGSIFVVTMLSLSVSAASWAGDDEKGKMTLDQLPAPVQEAIKKAVGSGEITEVTKETEDGKTFYEAEYSAGEVEHAVKVSDAGKVVEEETKIDAKTLPKAVTDAIKSAHADGKIDEACLVKADGKTFYEIDVEVGETDHEMKITAKGKIISDTIEADDDEKGHKDAQDNDDDKGEKNDEKGEHHKGHQDKD